MPSGDPLIVGRVLAALLIAVSPAGGSVIGAAITAVLALGTAIYLNHVGRKRENLNRRRDLYSEAYRAALEWCEAVYRVRRRATDGSEDRDLVMRLHDLQERIAYYHGWLSIESASLGQTYQGFLDDVMDECKPLIQAAWAEPGRPPTQPTPEDEPAPELDEARETFLRAVREHLSGWWESV